MDMRGIGVEKASGQAGQYRVHALQAAAQAEVTATGLMSR